MSYIRTGSPTTEPQLLQLNVGGKSYHFALLHAEVEEHPRVTNGIPRLAEGQHAHDIYHMVLYAQGNNRFVYNDRRHASQRGVLLVTSPGQPHNFGPLQTQRIISKEITFCWEGEQSRLRLPVHTVLSLLAGTEFAPIDFPVQLDELQTRALEDVFDRLLQRLRVRNDLSWFAEQQLMFELFNLLIREICEVRHLAEEAEGDPVLRAKREIEQYYHERISLPQLAQSTCLSTGYFSRAFKERFGISPIAYQLELRITAAKTLLTDSSRSISEIATLVGFSDVYAFSKAFKKVAGVSPREFRKRE